jgi:porphobilinogen synthase
MTGYPIRRLRRLRYNPTIRQMLAGVRLNVEELIAPLFVREGTGLKREIPSMPGQYQFSVDTAVETARRWAEAGILAMLLFGLGEKKDAVGSGAWTSLAAVQRLIGEIKKALPRMVVITDVCLCEYTDHGHCGTLARGTNGTTEVDNDATLQSLAKTALSHAEAGADIVAPSAMMDGQVSAIRAALDAAGHNQVGILSYAVKFASSFYGPFRDAADSAPQFGDRRGYQMDYRNQRGILSEVLTDIEEGADMIMVKPAGPCLDVIATINSHVDLPLAAYQVSGEYSAIKAAAQRGWLDERAAVMETVTAIKRAGANLIVTYFAEQLAQWL